MREENRALLDRILMQHGTAPITPFNSPRVVPSNRPVHPWRRMAAMEADANKQFREMFPTADDLMAAKKEPS